MDKGNNEKRKTQLAVKL